MTYILFYIAGMFTVFGMIGVVNFVMYRLAMKSVRKSGQRQHEDAVRHWERLEEV